MTRLVFLDTETTGTQYDAGDRIVEIGCVEMINRRLTGRHLHFYLNPQRAIHSEALKIHGLSEDFLADKPLFEAKADELLAFVAGAEVVAHNATFDVGFLEAELRRLSGPRFVDGVAKVTDSFAMARELYPGKACSLDALCRRLEVDNSHRTRHGALLDAELLAEVYIRMTRGQDSLVIDVAQGTDGDAHGLATIDLAAFELPVIEPSETELAAHAAVLADLDKASGGRTMWRERMA